MNVRRIEAGNAERPLYALLPFLYYENMTREKFTESLLSSGFSECPGGEGCTLYERDGSYIFAFPSHIASPLYDAEWHSSYEDIRLTRSRRGWFEIEKTDGSSIVLSSDDDIEIGCMG